MRTTARATRRLVGLAGHVTAQATAQQQARCTVPGAGLAGVGGRMGGQLDELGARSVDPLEPTLDVGTVKLFENDRIRVWDMCVEPGGDTSYHKHVHPYIFLQIGSGLCTTEGVDPATGEVTASGSVSTVGAKSCTWSDSSEENPKIHKLINADAENNYRQILIEFLEDAPRHSPEEVAECLSNAASTTEVGSGLLFENDRCRVHDFSLAPHSGEDLPWHHHTLPYFFVNTCGGPNSPGVGFHGLVGARGQEEGSETFKLWSQDRDMSFQDVPFGGYAEDRTPVHMDKVWNDTDVPYSSFIVEIK
jgi:quercetin dioxygenase-like cupin family protein